MATQAATRRMRSAIAGAMAYAHSRPVRVPGPACRIPRAVERRMNACATAMAAAMATNRMSASEVAKATVRGRREESPPAAADSTDALVGPGGQVAQQGQPG